MTLKTPCLTWGCLSAALVVAFVASSAQAVELITNGDFETGVFGPWVVTNQAGGSGGEALIAPGTPNPSGFTTSGAGGLPHGNFVAVSYQSGPGTHAISQGFVVPGPAANVTLTFDMFVNDYDGGPFVNPAGLDYTATPNENGRVDILTAAAAPLSTTAGLLSNLYLGADAPLGANPHDFTHYVFDITGAVGAGGAFAVRFAEVDNQGFFVLGVDNVSINFTPTPEPSSVVLAMIGAVAIVGVYRRRRPA